VQKIFQRSRSPPTRPDIRKLRDDLEIQGKYSARLNALLLGSEEKEENSRELNEVEGCMMEAILEASQEMIPKSKISHGQIQLTKSSHRDFVQRRIPSRERHCIMRQWR